MGSYGWTCPEDGRREEGATPEEAEQAVRLHFRLLVHEDIELAGFMDGGPVIVGVTA